MKDLNYYLGLNYPFTIHQDESGYAITYPDLLGCISSGDSLEEVIQNGNNAKNEWLDIKYSDGDPIPEPGDSQKYSGKFYLRIPKTLHADIARKAEEEGTSMNQFLLHIVTKGLYNSNKTS